MNDLAMSLLLPLGRTTLLAAGAAVVVFTLLRATRCSSPGLHRLAACLVLVIGWLFIRLPVAIPYYAAPSGGWRSSEASPQHVSDESPRPSEDRLAILDAQPTEIVPEKADAPTVVPTASLAVKPPDNPTPKSWRDYWPVALLGVWLTGMIALAVCWTAGYIRFILRLPQGEPARADWTRQWNELLSAAGVSGVVPIRMTRRLGPILCRTPGECRLFLPLELWDRLTPVARLSVLRHELAHYRRRDAWKSLAVRILALPHWFNPATWWAVRRFDEAAEWACDRVAAAGGEKTAVEFARTLLDLGEPSVRVGCYGAAARGRGLSIRVRRLLASQTMEDTLMKRLLVGVVALGLIVVCLLQFDLVAKQPVAESVAVAENAAAEEKPSKPSPPLESLRYDGKSFQQWQDELATELKAERRAEALEAFGAFGGAGYGREAAEVILDVIREMKVTSLDASLRHGNAKSPPLVGPALIKQTGLRAFVSDSHGYRIPAEDTLPVLMKELKTGNRNGRLFAIFVLNNMRTDAVTTVAQLFATLEYDEDALVRLWAFRLLTKIAPDGENMAAAVRLVLKDADPDNVIYALSELVSQQQGYRVQTAASIFQSSRSRSRYPSSPNPIEPGYHAHLMQQTLSRLGVHLVIPTLHVELRPEGAKILEALIEAVDDSSPSTRLKVIQAIGRIGPAAKEAAGGLTGAFEKSRSEERAAIAHAWVNIGTVPAAAKALLWQTVRDDEQELTRIAAMQALTLQEELDPQVGVPLLIESFPKRELPERMAIVHLLTTFGPDAAPAADVLGNSMQDIDEQIMRLGRGNTTPIQVFEVAVRTAMSRFTKAIEPAE